MRNIIDDTIHMEHSIVEKLMRISVEFQALSYKARNDAQEEYKKNESSSLSALRLTLDGEVSRLFMRFIEKIENTDEKKSYQLSLSASFIRTHFIINDLILAGDIIEAITLIRKQIENLTRLIEINDKPLAKLLKKTPNVCQVLDKIGKSLYPLLSEVAHFGTPRVGELIKIETGEEGKSGPSVFPVFSTRLYDVYKTHAFISIVSVFWIIDFIKSLYKEQYDSASDIRIINEIYRLAIDIGIFLDTDTEK